MKNTISDARFVNTLPSSVVAMIEVNPAKWAYAMNKNRILRKQLKYRGETMDPATFSELTLTDFGALLDGSMEMPLDFDYRTHGNKGEKPRAAWYSGNIWPARLDHQSSHLGAI